MRVQNDSSHHPPVWFPGWSDALHQRRLPAGVRMQYRTAVIQYLRFCKQTHQRATMDLARRFMQELEAQRRLGVSMLANWKTALNWFFEEASRQPPPTVHPERPTDVMTDVPSFGPADLGKSDWERKLIRELRGRHYRWRTEQTYRQWAWRFAEWMQQRNGGLARRDRGR
jgi:hypothetical protein